MNEDDEDEEEVATPNPGRFGVATSSSSSSSSFSSRRGAVNSSRAVPPREKRGEMALESLVDQLEGFLKLPSHRGIQFDDDEPQIGGRLLHVAHLPRQEVEARLQLFVCLRRIRIVATEILDARAKLIDLTAQSGHFLRGQSIGIVRTCPLIKALSNTCGSASSLSGKILAYLPQQRLDGVTRSLRLYDTSPIFDLNARQFLPLSTLSAFDFERLLLQLTLASIG